MWITFWHAFGICVVLMSLLIAPIVTYWHLGYARRKSNILGSLNGDAPAVYFKTFHPDEYDALRDKAEKFDEAKRDIAKHEEAQSYEAKLGAAKRELEELEKDKPEAEILAAATADAPNNDITDLIAARDYLVKFGTAKKFIAKRDAAEANVAAIEGDKPEAQVLDPAALEAKNSQLDELEKVFKGAFAAFYKKRFGLWRFICPFILMICVAVPLLGLATSSVLNWIKHQSIETGPLPAQIVLAILGGYVWVLYDVVLKSTNESLLPRDLYWAAFRMLVSVPAGWALKPFDERLKLPLAFCIAALPAWSLQSIARRIAYQIVGANKDAADTVNELVSLPCIDFSTAQNLSDEGITSISQLANWDPVELTIRLGLPFSYVVGIVGDALLWSYLNNKDRMDAFRMRGISGAFDCRLFLYDLTETDDPQDKKDAQDTLADLSTALKVSPGGITILIWNVANDPNSRFIYAVWGDIVN